jgi:uncharacterized protein YjbJ (UPF0337 family)
MEVDRMDKDSVKGTVDDAMGRAKRQVGEWTGNANQQVEGTAQQVKGKAEKVFGQIKDAARDMQSDADRERQRNAERDQQHADQQHADQQHAGAGSRQNHP